MPVVFALAGSMVVTSIDGKPKGEGLPARVRNIQRDPRVTLLFHHYEEDWDQLWWVRIDGEATLEFAGKGFESGVAALRDRYRQYETVAINGPVIYIAPTRFVTWSSR